MFPTRHGKFYRGKGVGIKLVSGGLATTYLGADSPT